MLRMISMNWQDSAALGGCRPLSAPLRQIFLLCSQKIHEQLTVGC